MQINTKAQIARATLTALTVVASIFFIWIIVLVLCAGLQINPFKETYVHPYFTCTVNRDGDYLKQFFSGRKVEVSRKY